MSKLAFIGEISESMGFKALGLEHFLVSEEKLPPLEWEEYNLVIVTEEIFQKFGEHFSTIQNRLPHLTVLLVPSEKGKLGLGEQRVRQVLERIVGSDILARREA